MGSNYKKWFELEITHNYFERSVFKEFELVLLEETSKAFEHCGVISHQNENRISFYIDSEKNEFWKNIEGLNTINFQLITHDPLFFSYTDLPFLRSGEIYGFTNQANDSLQSNNFASTSDLTTHYPKQINISLRKTDDLIEIKTNQGKTVYKSINSGKQNFPLDLAVLEDGVYQLWINGQQKQRIFISDDTINARSIGIVSIDVAQLIENYIYPKKMTLSFNAQSAYFEYQVVIPEARKIELEEIIVSSAEGEVYDGPKEEIIICKQKAIVFTSKKSFQLQSSPKALSQLVLKFAKNLSKRDSELERKLPYPDLQCLKKYKDENGQEGYLLTTIVYV